MRKVILYFVLGGLPLFAARQFQNTTDTLLGGTDALPSTGSVSFMLYPQFAANVIAIPFEVGNGPGTIYFQIVRFNTGRLYVEWSNGTAKSTAYVEAGNYNLPQNAWSNLVVTWVNGGTMTLYLNGTAIAAGNSAVPWFSTAGLRWSLGNRASGGYAPIGRIALFGVWSRILVGSEIAKLNVGNAPSALPNGLVSEYDLAGSSLDPQAGTGGTLVASGTVAAGDPPPPPPPPPPVLTLAGAKSASVGTPAYFTIGETFLANATQVSLSDGGAAGSITPASATLTSANPFMAFAYTQPASGSFTISMTNNQGIANPPALNLQVTAPQPRPTLSVDATAKSVTRGTDVNYVITQAIPSGYTGDTPVLEVFNVPAGFSFTLNGKDCGTSNAVISYFNWNNCGPSPTGTSTMTIHTGSMSPGIYYFAVKENSGQVPNGSGLTLTLTVN